MGKITVVATRLALGLSLVAASAGHARADAGGVEQRYAKRATLGVEIAPTVAVPFKKYLDFGSGQDVYTMENGVGFGFALAVTLNNVELRWAYTQLSAGRVRGRIPDGVFNELASVGFASGQDIDIEAPEPLVFHNLTLGYRFGFDVGKRFRLAIPLGFGLTLALPPDFGVVNYTLFGFGGHAGALFEYRPVDWIALGADARLSIYVTEPDPNLGAAGLAATKSVFDNAVAWLPLLNVGLHARLIY